MAKEVIETRLRRTIGALVLAQGGTVRITRQAAEDITNWGLWQEEDPVTGDLIFTTRPLAENTHA